tara:strand:- start:4380 stop:6755 length:2376 start_codon:yes stop_codon:yes gene_type:complete
MELFKNKKHFIKIFNESLNKTFKKSIDESSTEEKYFSLNILIQKYLKERFKKSRDNIIKNNSKKTIYFSMEFLIGRMIKNNLYNLGVYNIVKESLADRDIDINELEEFEVDAGLGNGGLGRLAACFLDSAASLQIPLYGNSIRYKKGFFHQKFENYKQVEYDDEWLEKNYIWEEKKENEHVFINYYGNLEKSKLIDPITIKAVPYDIYISGYSNGIVNRLRLWSIESSKNNFKENLKYKKILYNVSRTLYPDDSTEEGKILRIQQQYFFSSAGVQDSIREFKNSGKRMNEFYQYYTFQLNDTHPTVVILELMRILIDEENLSFDLAWEITQKTCAYTNHTILSEALEKWDKKIYKMVLPRIYEILTKINERFNILLEKNDSFNNIEKAKMRLIGEKEIRMANIAIYGSKSVNGVAKLHTDILKNHELNEFYRLFPKKFNNKTNGVNHKRWLFQINPELTNFIDEKIGKDYHENLKAIEKLISFKEDRDVLSKLKLIKDQKKMQLVKYIKEKEDIDLNVDAIFDIQIKRLHEYKRQLMNIMHIIHVYLELKNNKKYKKNYVPHNFIFGAKAAPSYEMAKLIIELIKRVEEKINNDHETNNLLKVVFVSNYNVSYAEQLIPAADISEQISTASKEASGTGNMKFMMNGAITIGTMDGANVEIVEKVGNENAYIFGLTAEEVNILNNNNSYNPNDIIESDPRIKRVFDFIKELTYNPYHFNHILDSLRKKDIYYIIKDFSSYIDCHKRINQDYKDQMVWQKKALVNISKSSFFSSNRTILDYNDHIWKLKKIKF